MTSNGFALVTGGTSGIGKAVALGLAKAGWTVTICGRRAELLSEITRDGQVDGAVCDVTRPEEVANLFAGIRKKQGRLDLVFNNAGRFAPAKPFGDLDVATWREMIDTNLNGAFYVAREAFRLMREQSPQGGRIINNGSISAYAPRPGSVPYTATKHAITGLTKTLALDGRPFDIACGQIDIGNALTDMAVAMTKGVPQANGTTAVEEVMDVQHVANAVVHMASLPLEANVLFMNVMATKMPFVGRG